MTDLPDISGFKDAQIRLVQGIGDEAIFKFSSAAVYWGSANFVDSYTGEPIDPVVEVASALVFSPKIVKCTVIRNNPRGDQSGVSTEGGVMQRGNIWIRIPEGTYPEEILVADRVDLHDSVYRIERFFKDGISADPDCLYVEAALENPAFYDVEPSGGLLMAAGRSRNDFVADGSASAFSLTTFFINGTVELFIDGILQAPGASGDYVEAPPSSIQMTYTPTLGQLVSVMFSPY